MPPAIVPPDVITQFNNSPAPQPALLTVNLANVTAYYQDTVDLTLLAQGPTQPDPINTNNLAKNNFLPIQVVVADIVGINGDTAAKGLYLSKNLVTKSSPTAALGSGTNISDATITGFRDDIFKILYTDPTAPATVPPTTMEIGSITASGVSGHTVPPGGPLNPDGTPVIGGGDWSITGGTGAFLGVTGQMGGQGQTVAGQLIRAASAQEDPSYRIINIDNEAQPSAYVATMYLNVIPMMPTQIIEIFHAASFHHGALPIPTVPVTQANPAKVGEPLILYATGLGPVRYKNENNVWADLPIGKPFPANATVISPVTITISNVETIDNNELVLTQGASFTPQSAQGSEGFSNGYSVEFTLPDFSPPAAPGKTTIQISSAWIQSAPVTLYVAAGYFHP